MKLTPSTNLLLMTALWLDIALSDVRCALRATGMQRTEHLIHARAGARRFRSYAAMWRAALHA